MKEFSLPLTIEEQAVLLLYLRLSLRLVGDQEEAVEHIETVVQSLAESIRSEWTDEYGKVQR